MAMNNVYYRFVHLVHAADYKTLPARLRMTAMAKPGVDKVDFELWSLVVSAINGCGMCLEAHEKVLREHGLSAEQIQAGGAHRRDGPRRRARSARKRLWRCRWRKLPRACADGSKFVSNAWPMSALKRIDGLHARHGTSSCLVDVIANRR